MADALAFLRALGHHVAGHLEELATRIVDETYRTVDGYADVPRDDFLSATRDTLSFIVRSLTSEHLIEDADWDFDVETVRRRLRQGVRAKDWIAQNRVFLGVVREAATRFGDEAGFADADVMAAILAIDEMAQSGIAFAGSEFERAADELVHEDEAERREFIAGLLRGELAPGAMRSGVAAIGLDPGAVYRAVRIRAFAARDSSEILRRVLRAEPTVQPRGTWAALEGDVCGITRDDPPANLDGAAAGVGPAVPLEAVASSYAVATAALETALGFGLSGAHRIEDLGALPMVVAGGRAGDALAERFVHAVERTGTAGPALVETVTAYLERGLQVGTTAKALHLHPNSLRKRLRRYEELTGADLSSMDDLAAVWWALKRREMDARQSA